MALELGHQLQQGRYTIQEFLSQGGMGTIYLAEDRNLPGREVAIKENLETTDMTQQQFHFEAIMLARLTHPSLPRVTDHFTEPNGAQYLVMDYVSGDDLRTILHERNEPLPEDLVLEWLEQIMSALIYMHNWIDPITHKPLPIIHRDIKPGNIKRTPNGRVVLVDFGIAKYQEPTEGTVLGARGRTPGFSPLEQYAGHTDARSDIYALGATCYRLLTNQRPPDATAIAAGTPLRPPRFYNPNISPRTERVIMRAMALHAPDRYQSVAEMRDALLHKDDTDQEPPTVLASTTHTETNLVREQTTSTIHSQPRWGLWATLSAVAALLLLVAFFMLIPGSRLLRIAPPLTTALPTQEVANAEVTEESGGMEISPGHSPSPAAALLPSGIATQTATLTATAPPSKTTDNSAESSSLLTFTPVVSAPVVSAPVTSTQVISTPVAESLAAAAATATEFPPATPTALPTATPTVPPTATVTDTPTDVPTVAPTATELPPATPTALPTATPTVPPTATVTDTPTDVPTAAPTATATELPPATPTALPTATPTVPPTATVTDTPTDVPTAAPTDTPTPVPTATAADTATPPPTGTPTEVPTNPPPPPEAGDVLINEIDGARYRFVPAGSFAMGSTVGPDEMPVHDVYLDAFWIMETEVTNALYAQCVEAGACTAPANDFWQDPELAAHPVTHVDWAQANEYAQWSGARLPTEAEWEKAARGTDQRTFPWPDDDPGEHGLNINGVKTVQADNFPESASPYGALNMAGNVEEWVVDWYSPTYYAESPPENPQGPEEGMFRVARGGSFSSNRGAVRTAKRGRALPDTTFPTVGFRLVIPVSEGASQIWGKRCILEKKQKAHKKGGKNGR